MIPSIAILAIALNSIAAVGLCLIQEVGTEIITLNQQELNINLKKERKNK